MAKSPTSEQLATLMAELAALKAQVEAQAKPAPKAKDTSKAAAMDKACIVAFAKAGLGPVVPRVDALTFNRWVAQGFRPIEGTKSVKVGQFRLFCRQQVRPVTPEDLAKIAEQKAAYEARKAGGNVVPLKA